MPYARKNFLIYNDSNFDRAEKIWIIQLNFQNQFEDLIISNSKKIRE